MRWCYKTVHFPMKKEGFLGSAFLDEAEVEQALNEYGQSGWELTSIIETQDGVIAFFKQPLGTPNFKNEGFREPEEVEPSSFANEIVKTTQSYDEEELHHDDDSPDNDDIHTIRIE
ncbi:MAG: DUF4177 domain-containing protein [Desulfocapsaceae bacterium]|nr:DUF4177 domain-containing protein [Desulfocapsaceae bacterium]